MKALTTLVGLFVGVVIGALGAIGLYLIGLLMGFG